MHRQLPLLLALSLWIGAAPADAFFKLKQEEPATDALQVSAPLPAGGTLGLLLYPSRLVNVIEGDTATVVIRHRISGSKAEVTLRFESSRPDLIGVVGADNVTLSPEDNSLWDAMNGSATVAANFSGAANSSRVARIRLQGRFLGRASIVIMLRNGSREDGGPAWSPLRTRYKVSVIRRLRWIDRIFTGVVICLVVIANLGMGTKLELRVVKKVLKKPLAPVIGFISQYTFMPLVAFGVGTLLDLPATILLGYFAMGCAPGGGASNFYTFLLGGDVSLSITMTLLSTLAALGMVPLWLFTLGRYILQNQEHTVKIPFQNIIISLVTMLVPIGIGYLIKKKLPKVANIINKVMKPFLIFLVIFFFTAGVYANLYIFRMFSPLVIAAGCLLPYCGFILGGLVALIARLKFSFVKTVAIETGIQNTGVPIFLLKFSLPQPDSDISIVGPIASSMFTPLPLFICIIIRESYRRCCKKAKKEDEEDDAEAIEVNGNVEKSDEPESKEKSKSSEDLNEKKAEDQEPFLDAHRETSA